MDAKKASFLVLLLIAVVLGIVLLRSPAPDQASWLEQQELSKQGDAVGDLRGSETVQRRREESSPTLELVVCAKSSAH